MARNYGLLALAVFAAAALAYSQFSPPEAPQVPMNREQPAPKRPIDAAPTAQKGDFDFYVLALSWSPSFCASEGSNQTQQCGATKNYGFVVHGLWPQNHGGYPEFCATSEPERVPDQLGRSLFDIMPSMGLIGHQWRKHGSCSGLSQKEYFGLTRSAYDAINIPANYQNVTNTLALSPDAVEQAFIKSNPGLKPDQIAVTCSSGMIDEVRICMKSDLSFQSCAEVNQKSCRAKSAKLPPQ